MEEFGFLRGERLIASPPATRVTLPLSSLATACPGAASRPAGAPGSGPACPSSIVLKGLIAWPPGRPAGVDGPRGSSVLAPGVARPTSWTGKLSQMRLTSPWTSWSQVRGPARVSPICLTWVSSRVLRWASSSWACERWATSSRFSRARRRRSRARATRVWSSDRRRSRFDQVIIGPQAQGLDRAVQAGMAGEEDNFRIRGVGLDMGEQIQAGSSPGASDPGGPGRIPVLQAPPWPPGRPPPRSLHTLGRPETPGACSLTVPGHHRPGGSFAPAINASLQRKSRYPDESCHRPSGDNPGCSAAPGFLCACRAMRMIRSATVAILRNSKRSLVMMKFQ